MGGGPGFRKKELVITAQFYQIPQLSKISKLFLVGENQQSLSQNFLDSEIL